MKQIRTFNGWLLSKINNYLITKEGCTLDQTHYTADGIRSVVTDSFGFRYEITVTAIGRLNDGNGEDIKRYENIG